MFGLTTKFNKMSEVSTTTEPHAISNLLLADSKPAQCKKCGREMKPAPAKLRADGEQTYCGYLPCACDKRIMTDFGVVYPNTEEHNMLLEGGRFSYSDLL